MKAVILAAGRGTRLEGITEPCNKCMLKFRGQFLIEYSLQSATRANVSEIVIVVGYRAEDIINTFGIAYHGVRIRYVIQRELKGLVNAIETCQEASEGEDFMLFLADELLIDPNPSEMAEVFEKEGLFVICGVTQVEDISLISRTYSVIYNAEDSRIYRLIEKPVKPVNNIMGTGNCIFRNEIFNYIPRTPINQTRQQKELPDLIQCTIDDGHPVKLFHISAEYVNINTPDDIRLAAEQLYNKD
jgi:NDP-sugar pyrophosphorylase family protein